MPVTSVAREGWLARVPASFFGMPLGLLAAGLLWRAAAVAWPWAVRVERGLLAAGAGLWCVIALLWGAKWLASRAAAARELEHPVQCCFVGLAGVGALLAAIGALPYLPPLAAGFGVVGGAWTAAFALWRTGRLWRGERDISATTPVLYLPAVGGGFVLGSALAAFGHADLGQLAFGAALFTWLAVESVLLHRLYVGPAMPPALRPTLGIQLAPPAVGAVAYLNVGAGVPDLFAHALVGYALLQFLLLARMVGWLRVAGAGTAWWAFSFGLAALPTALWKLVARGDGGAIARLAPVLTVVDMALIGAMVLMTAWLAVRGRLLPK